MADAIIGIIARQRIAGGAFWFRKSVPLKREDRGENEMIVGMGVDIAEIDRIEAAIARHGAPFLERIYTPREAAYCEEHKNKFERYAARFAAKEAAMKALGTGWRLGVRWRDIEVANAPGGKPTLNLEGIARQFAERMGVKNISLSITHSGNLALAQVVFEG